MNYFTYATRARSWISRSKISSFFLYFFVVLLFVYLFDCLCGGGCVGVLGFFICLFLFFYSNLTSVFFFREYLYGKNIFYFISFTRLDANKNIILKKGRNILKKMKNKNARKKVFLLFFVKSDIFLYCQPSSDGRIISTSYISLFLSFFIYFCCFSTLYTS